MARATYNQVGPLVLNIDAYGNIDMYGNLDEFSAVWSDNYTRLWRHPRLGYTDGEAWGSELGATKSAPVPARPSKAPWKAPLTLLGSPQRYLSRSPPRSRFLRNLVFYVRVMLPGELALPGKLQVQQERMLRRKEHGHGGNELIFHLAIRWTVCEDELTRFGR